MGRSTFVHFLAAAATVAAGLEARSLHTYCLMFALICRLFLVVALVGIGTLASFEAAARPFLRLPVLRMAPKHSATQLHRPNYRPYKAYRHF